MEKYKANRNDEEPSKEEKTEEEQEHEAVQKTTKLAAKAVGDYFTGGVISQASNMPVVGDKVDEALDKVADQAATVIEKTPMVGKTVGKIANKLDETGLIDAASEGYDMIGGLGSGGVPNSGGATSSSASGMNNVPGIKGMNNFSGNNNSVPNSDKLTTGSSNKSKKVEGVISQKASAPAKETVSENKIDDELPVDDLDIGDKDTDNDNDEEEKEEKGTFIISSIASFPMKLAIVSFGFLCYILIMFVVMLTGKDIENLKLTNTTALASSYVGSSSSCTVDDINSRIFYIGDNKVSNTSNNLTSSGANYNWLINNKQEIESKLINDSNMILVFSLGDTDAENADSYIDYYKDLSKNYNNKIFIVSTENEEYNNKLKNSFSNNYLDLSVTSGETNITNKIPELIINTKSVVCSGGSISDISQTSLSGGGFDKLSAGETIISQIGSDKLNNWNQLIKNDVIKAGVGTGDAVSIAAYDLIQGALNEKIVIPYLWGGGHGKISEGINGNWGAKVKVTAFGSSAQPAGSYQADGLDCSGFVSWALKNGGCTNFTPIVARSFQNLGNKTTVNAAVAGDIAANNSHVMLILKNTGSSLVVAEAKGARYGIIFSEYKYSQFNKYTLVSMSNYYANNCKG